MKIADIMGALADVIKLADKVDRLDETVSEMATLFREDSKARDEKFLEHDRRIQKLENLIEFAEKFGGQKRIE
jgi:Asp-tRNA(Asn)/Glu-tRNA(Gln) amidotransferase C subunit